MKRILILTLALLITLPLITAHKEAAESTAQTSLYTIDFGVIPHHLKVNDDTQILYVKVKHTDDNDLIGGMTVKFEIYKNDASKQKELISTAPSLLVKKMAAEEKYPGVYSFKYMFTETGNYVLVANVYDEDQLVTSIQKLVQVEPEGPSIYFWITMLIGVMGAMFISTKSSQV